jgi:cytochrome P450
MNLTIDAARRRVSLNPRDPDFFNDPYPAYAAIRKAAPIFFWEDYGFWCFARYADVSALLRDRRFGRQILHVMSRAELGWPEPSPRLEPFDALERHSILELEPPEHTRLRNLVNRAFVSRRIEKLGTQIAAFAHERIDSFARAGSAELIADFAAPIPVAVIADLLGVPRDMGPHLVDWSHRMVAMYQFGEDRAAEDRAAEAARAFTDFVRDYARARRGDLGDDLISQLLIAESEGGKLSEDELISTVILLLNAGHEATVHAIGNGIKTMLDHRVDPRSAFASESAVAATVEELLRLDAPLHLFTRYALEDTELAGVSLRKGQKIGLLLGAANWDPERFPNPGVFDPARVASAHVSFGAGIHFCLGAPLARLELAVALPILFARLPDLRLIELARYRDSFHFHGLEALKVKWSCDRRFRASPPADKGQT